MLSRIIGLGRDRWRLPLGRDARPRPRSLQKVTIAFAGKGMSFLLQYIAIGGGFYKQEGLEPESVDVSSGTRQAAAVMGGSAEITQVGFAHTMHAVGRGGAAGRDLPPPSTPIRSRWCSPMTRSSASASPTPCRSTRRSST